MTTKGYLIIGGAVLTVLILVFVWGRSSKKLQTDHEQQLAREYGDALSAHGLSASMVARHVEDLRLAFGWNASALGFNFWTEDEAAIIAVVGLYDAASFPLLADAYRLRLKRDLKSDLREFLNSNEYGQIAHIAG